ncbi:sacsin N-terminal ATP-binding-like domain-containing protein, partial [Actinomycetospora atypica]
MPPDPFGTAALRRAVLDAWSASPARLREDANAEEDLVRGGYRDRWFVELAQNAADAGIRAGAPTTLSVRTDGTELVVGNTGAPLDAAGVASLASLRASAKRGPDEAVVGRFGVGFAAVLDLGDAPRVVTRIADGVVGVAFDRSRTYDEVLALGGAVADEARRRGPDGVPALRLVWPAEDTDLPDDVTTAVRVPLAKPADELLDQVRAEARDLLLALPGLGAVEVEGRGRLERHDDGGGRVTVGGVVWTTLRCGGELPPELRHDEAGRDALAVEDRGRTRWEGLWAWTPGADPHDVLYAPTPTAEGTTLPARLVVTVPLDADRRRVRPGRLTTHVLRAAAAHLPELVAALAPADRTRFVPGHGLPASEVDAVLQEAATDALRRAAWLP